MRDAALAYGAHGWPVLRVTEGTKEPIDKQWQNRATTDPATIRAWWADRPQANVGLLCGRAFDVLDIEAPALPAFGAWLTEHGRALPEAPMARTGRAGVHVYLRPGGTGTRVLWLGDLRLGELRGVGGQVLAPPSRTVGTYSWMAPPDGEPLPGAPAWIAELVRPAKPPVPVRAIINLRPDAAAAKLEALARAVATAPEGQRNALTFWAACRAFEEGHPPTVAEAVLYRAALAAGLTERETVATLRSARRTAGTR